MRKIKHRRVRLIGTVAGVAALLVVLAQAAMPLGWTGAESILVAGPVAAVSVWAAVALTDGGPD